MMMSLFLFTLTFFSSSFAQGDFSVVYENHLRQYLAAQIKIETLTQEFDTLIQLSPETALSSRIYSDLNFYRSYAEEIEEQIANFKVSVLQSKMKSEQMVLMEKIYNHLRAEFKHQSLFDLYTTPLFHSSNLKEMSAQIRQSLLKEELAFQGKSKFNILPTTVPLYYPSSQKNGNITGNEFPAKVWSLTFDDGPAPKTTPVIVEQLKEHKIKASFFQLTRQVLEYPQIALNIKSQGHEIASHSYSHQQLTKLNEIQLEREINQAVKDLEKALEIKTTLFRFPYGAGVNHTGLRERLRKLQLMHIFWNVDTLDWKVGSTPDEIYQRTITQMKNSKNDAGIILFHDIHERTAQTVPRVLKYLQTENRRVCLLKDIIHHLNTDEPLTCP